SRTIGVVICVQEDRVEPAFEGSALDTLDQVGKKRIGNVRDQQADDVGASGSQGTGLGIWIIVALFDRLQNVGAGAIGHVFRLVDDVRNRGGRNSRLARDVLEPGSLWSFLFHFEYIFLLQAAGFCKLY